MDKNQTSRREFLKESVAGMSALLSASELTRRAAPAGVAAGSVATYTALKEAFLKPPHDSKPLTRWWWFGGAATPEEITRELEMMRDGGLRGIELQPVYPVAVDDAKLGVRNTRYFSPEWFNLLRHTLAETKRLGLQFDFTLGSGWPYGGPFIPERLAAQKITVIACEAHGPTELSWPLFPYLTGDGRVFAVVAAPVLDSGTLDLTRSVVLDSEHRGAIRWSVPEGRWRVLAFTDSLTGQLVKRPTLGMEGYVIDHFDEKALDLFLDAVGERTIRELHSIADPPFHSVFCDSLEVYGADWTPRFMEEFRKRRGYDLAPYLPALWEDAGEVTPGVRYDYHLTLSDLIVENFFQRLQSWSRQHGMTARVQAHGAMGDVMQGYAAADIPEGEEGLNADRYAVIIDHRRLASSAAHIYGKPVVSCESYTWLRQPRFLVTLEEMKGATDSSFLDGINQIVNQGYSYSPPQAGEPGWVFYASTMVNHNNIWWPHYRYLAAYIQRAAAVLLQGAPVNPVAVYVPLADIYSHYGLGSLTMDTAIQRRLGSELFTQLRQAGYDFDLINDDALTRLAHVEDGKLRAGTAEYAVVIIPGVEFMTSENLDRLAEFAQGGGTLIFTERLPATAPGLKQRESGTQSLRGTLERIFPTGPTGPSGQTIPDVMYSTGRGRTVLALERLGAIKHVRAVLAPDFQIVKAGDGSAEALQRAVENVGFAHRKAGDTDFYFISNISRFEHALRIRFAVDHRAPERWNPEDGTIEETLAFEYVGTRGEPVTEVAVSLEPFESCFILFARPGPPVITTTNLHGPLRVETSDGTRVSGIVRANGEYFAGGARGSTRRTSVADLPSPIAVTGPWRLTLGGGSVTSRGPEQQVRATRSNVPQLKSWSEFPEGKNYSGWGVYETAFEMPHSPESTDWTLDLGEVHETAEAILNGVDLGAAWKGARRLACRNALRYGTNRLQVKVGNLWIQKVVSLLPPDLKPVAETFGIRWGLYGKTSVTELPPSGLLGPVRLLPSRRVAIALSAG